MDRFLLLTITLLISGLCAQGQIWIWTMDGKTPASAEGGLEATIGIFSRTKWPEKEPVIL